MASYTSYLLVCIHRFQAHARLGLAQHLPILCHLCKTENDSAFFLRKLLIICNHLLIGIEIYS